MLYDTSNSLERKKLFTRLDKIIQKGGCVRVEEPDVVRSLQQNAYLHLLLSYFSCQYGCSLEYAKRVYYKREVNPDLYVTIERDPLTERCEEIIRSSKDLTKEEMSLSIERFKQWSSMVAEIPLPDADSPEERRQALMEIERSKAFL